eukprot:4217698-Prymnesium_polylepis.1
MRECGAESVYESAVQACAATVCSRGECARAVRGAEHLRGVRSGRPRSGDCRISQGLARVNIQQTVVLVVQGEDG